jgi:hypothetical protein
MKDARFKVGMSIIALIAAVPGSAADWTAKVGQLQSTNVGLDCFYFTLNGIAAADPALGNNSPWFAIPRAQYGAKDAYAMLLAAKLSDVSVRVSTTGGTICGGYAQVSQMLLE